MTTQQKLKSIADNLMNQAVTCTDPTLKMLLVKAHQTVLLAACTRNLSNLAKYEAGK